MSELNRQLYTASMPHGPHVEVRKNGPSSAQIFVNGTEITAVTDVKFETPFAHPMQVTITFHAASFNFVPFQPKTGTLDRVVDILAGKEDGPVSLPTLEPLK